MQLFTLLLAIGNVFLNGFVFMTLWLWFPHEILGLPILGYAESIGLAFFITYVVKSKILNTEERDSEEVLRETFSITLFLLLTLGFGAIIHAFI